MKIGIATVPDSANFGSFLQAYALKLVLEEGGHSAVFFRTRDQEYLRKLFVNWRPKKRSIKHPLRFIMKNLNGREKIRKFLQDQELLEIREVRPEEELDLILLGSDEIWNVCTPVFRNPVFYGEYARPVPAAAWAVSAGRAKYEDFLRYPELIERIKRIPAVFVRDYNTRDIVEKITGKCPGLVCDPTILVPVEKLREKYEDPYLEKHRYLAVYLYPGSISGENVRQIRKYARKENIRLVSVGFCNSWCDYNVNCRPLEFPSVLEGAEAVITGTFHGTIFSVLSRKQFISIALTSKVRDLLQQLELEERCADREDLSLNLLENKLKKERIDYGRTEEILKNMRRSSLLQLKGVIAKYDK